MSEDRKPWHFQPGNPGKQKGTVNKLTAERRDRINRILNALDESIDSIIEAMTDQDKLKLWVELQEYVVPKLQRITLDAGTDDDRITKITFEVVKAGEYTEDQEPEEIE
jgi:hypothetical protein